MSPITKTKGTADAGAPIRAKKRLREHLRSFRTAVVTATLLALVLMGLIDSAYRQIREINRQRQHIETIRSATHALINHLTIVSMNQRGYLLADQTTKQVARNNIDEQASQWLRELDLALSQLPSDALSATDFKQSALQVPARIEDVQTLHDSGQRLLSQAHGLQAGQETALTRLLNTSRLAFFACVLAVLFAFLLYIYQRYRLDETKLERQQMLKSESERLARQVEERTRDLAELTTHLQQTVEHEREHLARELHDELGALMAAARFDVARLRNSLPPDNNELHGRLAHLKQLLNDAVALKRRLMEGLYPSALRNLGLDSALQILIRQFSESTGIAISTQLHPVNLGADTELAIYRMVQEALTNIGRHAHASRVVVNVIPEQHSLVICIEDNGKGFDINTKALGSYGLAGMRHRLQSRGGQLQIHSRIGAGTQITARLPLVQSSRPLSS